MPAGRLPLMNPALFGQGPTDYSLNTSTRAVAGGYTGLPAGSITAVGVYVTAVSAAPTYTVHFYSMVNGIPSSILASDAGSVTPTTTGFQWITLSTPYTSSLSGSICPVITYKTGTVGASNYANFGTRNSSTTTARIGSPAAYTYNGSAWSNVSGPPMIALKYSDGTIVVGGVPGTITSTAITTTSNPREIGNLFTAPYTCQCLGLQSFDYTDNGALSVLSLYDSANTLLATTSANNISAESRMHAFPTPATLIRGRQYRLAVRNGGGNYYQWSWDWPSTAERDQTAGEVIATTRPSGGSWTDIASRTYQLTPLLSGPTGSGLPLGEVLQ